MVTWTDYLMKQEQYRDLLREAEKERLIKQLQDDCGPSQPGQARGGLIAALTRRPARRDWRGPDQQDNPCGGQTRLAGKAA
jgi:hypothetical protein